MGNLFSSEGGCCDRLGKTSEEENADVTRKSGGDTTPPSDPPAVQSGDLYEDDDEARIMEARQKKIQSRKVDIDELTALADSAVKSGTPRVADSEQRGRDSAPNTSRSQQSGEQLKKTERSPRPMESSRRDQSQLKSSSSEKQPSRRAETTPKEEFVAPAESPTHKESLEKERKPPRQTDSRMESSSEEHNSARSEGGDSVAPKESAGVDRSSAEDSRGKGSRLSRKEISVQVDESTQYEQL